MNNQSGSGGGGENFIDSIEYGTCSDSGTKFFEYQDGFELVGFVCRGTGWFVGGIIVILGIQLLSNYFWTRIGSLQRVALAHPVHSHARMKAVRSMLVYMFASSCVHIVSTLAIMSSNFWLILTIILGNLLGAGISFTRAKPDCNEKQKWATQVELVEKYGCQELAHLYTIPKDSTKSKEPNVEPGTNNDTNTNKNNSQIIKSNARYANFFPKYKDSKSAIRIRNL
ncbi:hypothetical protein OAU26_03790 [Mariniblastus sp.]|nr:hypothetical protein [Mariniblastus sp.]